MEYKPGCSEHSAGPAVTKCTTKSRENAASCASMGNKIVSKSFDWSAKWKNVQGGKQHRQKF